MGMCKTAIISIPISMKDEQQIKESCISGISQLSKIMEIGLASEVYKKVLKECSYMNADYKDQISRAALSISLNCAEGIGKCRGYVVANYLIARGSAYEVWACLQVAPDELKRAILPSLEECIQLIEQRILNEID